MTCGNIILSVKHGDDEMISVAQSQMRKAVNTNKSAFWQASSKTFNNFQDSGLFQARKK